MNLRAPRREDLPQLYLEWLRKDSLRTIASRIGVHHSSLFNWFRESFGEDSVNPVAMSLQRSMIQDYPDDPVVTQWVLDHLGVRETTQHRSSHSIDQLTRYQTPRTATILEYMVEPTNNTWDSLEEPETCLRLPGLLLVLGATVEILVDLLAYQGDVS